VDSDDWVDTSFVEDGVKALLQTNADLVVFDYTVHYRNRVRKFKKPDYANAKDMLRDTLLWKCTHELWAKIMKMSVIKSNNIRFIEGANIAEDHYFMALYLYYSNKVTSVHKYSYMYNRTNADSYISLPQAANRKQSEINNKAIRDFFSDKGEEYEKLLNLKDVYEGINALRSGQIERKDIALLEKNRKYANNFALRHRPLFYLHFPWLISLYVKVVNFIRERIYKR